METISYTIHDKEELALSCIAFVKNGGLFLRVPANYILGTYVSVSLKLMTEDAPLVFEGVVVWITPPKEQNQLPEGVIVQFSEEYAEKVRNTIESIMPDAFAQDRKNDLF